MYCAIYRRDHHFLDQPGWMRFKCLAKRGKKLLRLKNQAKLRRYRTSPKHKFGYKTPRNNDHEQKNPLTDTMVIANGL